VKTTSVGAYRGTLRISLPIRTEPASPPRAGPCARAPLSPPAAPASFLCACGGSRFLWPLSPAYGAPVTSVTVPGGGRVGVPVPATLLPRGSALRILESPRRSPPQTALRLAVAPACTSSRTCLLAVRTTSSGCHARRPAARAAPRLRWVLGCRAGAGGAPACRGAWCLGCGRCPGLPWCLVPGVRRCLPGLERQSGNNSLLSITAYAGQTDGRPHGGAPPVIAVDPGSAVDPVPANPPFQPPGPDPPPKPTDINGQNG